MEGKQYIEEFEVIRPNPNKETVQFTLNPSVLNDLNLKDGDAFQVKILQIIKKDTGEKITPGENEGFFVPRVPKGSSKKITIKAFIRKRFNIQENDAITLKIARSA